MSALATPLRKDLEKAVIQARKVAEQGAAASLIALGYAEPDRPGHLSADDAALRTALRARGRQLGEAKGETGVQQGQQPLTGEIAYEQWHRMLFARFLAENGLLRHPEGASLTIEMCAELAPDEGARDGWDLAARYAGAMLPGLFRASDPAVRVRLAREHYLALEELVEALAEDVFSSDDGLGWVYQFWQVKQKEEVNKSGRKIGGADLASVTQLFTEDYMVRFLLENSLGAWWAGNHPESPLLIGYDYLRFGEDRRPAAGTFDGWPDKVAEVTVMDPCCGSGHFLVAAFEMLRQMRMEEEGLAESEAADAVLRDNLFGLELDPRCTQIATFALALAAWKVGGHPETDPPHVACSGIAVGGTQAEWERLGGNDDSVRFVLGELHDLFKDAPAVGSLIDPLRSLEAKRAYQPGFRLASWERVEAALVELPTRSVEMAVFAGAVTEAARGAMLLGRRYTLVATNVPYLGRRKQETSLASHLKASFIDGKDDLATAFLIRCENFLVNHGTMAVVTPSDWLTLTTFRNLRRSVLEKSSLQAVVLLGEEAWRSFGIRGPRAALLIVGRGARTHQQFMAINTSSLPGRAPILIEEKDRRLRSGTFKFVSQSAQWSNPDARITLGILTHDSLLENYAASLQGIATGDYLRFGRCFWERPLPHADWAFQQSTVEKTTLVGGREHILWWEGGNGSISASSSARVQGLAGLGEEGVSVSQMRLLPVTRYTGELFDNNTAVIIPKDPVHVPAIWALCSSPEFNVAVRRIDQKRSVTNATLVKVPFDL